MGRVRLLARFPGRNASLVMSQVISTDRRVYLDWNATAPLRFAAREEAS